MDPDFAVRVFPNPSSGYININLGDAEERDINVTLWDMTGRLVYITKTPYLERNTIKIDLSSFINGNYYLNVKTIKHSFTQKISIIRQY